MTKRKLPVDVFARLGESRPSTAVGAETMELFTAELLDTAFTVIPAIPQVEVRLDIQFRCTAPIVEGDVLQLNMPGFRGAPTQFTPKGTLVQNKMTKRQFHGYWSGDKANEKNGVGKQVMLLKCMRRVEAHHIVMLTVPYAVRLIGPEKLALNSSKIKISGLIAHAEEGKILKQSFLSTSEVKKQPVLEEIEEYKSILMTLDQTGGLDEKDVHVAEELSMQEVDHIWEAAHDRCPYPIGFQWHIAVSAFRSYESYGGLLRAIMENAIDCVKRRKPLGLYHEIATNFGVKLGAVIVFQDALVKLYGALYPDLPIPVLLAARLFTMEPVDIARTFLISDLPQLSLAQEIYSCFRTGDKRGLTKWAYTVSMLLLISNSGTGVPEDPSGEMKRTVLYHGIKELPQAELQYIRGLEEGSWYMFPCLTRARPSIKWMDEETFPVPDNAVLFEIHNAVDAVEVCDLSMYPYDRDWILPLCSSFRVKSVELCDDHNSLTHVVLVMHGCLNGVMKDSMIPEDSRIVGAVMKKLRSETEKVAHRTHYIVEHVYLTVNLRKRLRLHPQTLLRAQYVDHYFEVKYLSRAKKTIEDGSVNWQVCTVPAQMIDPVEGVIKHAVWEPMPRKFALETEQCFLAKTRAKKIFENPGVLLDFVRYVCDYAGKGPRQMRRLVKKRVTHEGPLPVVADLIA